MRILPITLSLLMIFTPAYSAYASMLPAKGQIVQIGKKGGALIKTGAGAAKKIATPVNATITAGIFAWDWCKKNQKKCKDYAGDAYEIICDVTSCDVERKDDDGFCVIPYYRVHSPFLRQPIPTYYNSFDDAFRVSISELIKSSEKEFKRDDLTISSISRQRLDDAHDDFLSQVSNYKGRGVIANSDGYTSLNTNSGSYTATMQDSNGSKVVSGTSIYFYVKDCDDDQRKERKKLDDDELNQLAKKIVQKMDDDDIINYYNTDYDDVTINNYHYYGDDIDRETNIDKYCNSNSCNEISKEIEQDIKQKKYDIDDVNEKNCTIEESTGKYIACNMTVKNEDEDNTTNNNETNQTDKKEDEDDKPPFCKTSDFFKEACEYFDWVDDEPSEKQDKKVDIEDEEEKLNKDRIDIDEGCPPDQHISVSMPWGYSTTIEFTYKPYCDFARDLKPYMTATGAIVSMYIVGSCGRRL